jgi:hypothetical protein
MSDALSAPPAEQAVLDGPRFTQLWFKWVSRVTSMLGGREPYRMAAYTVATLPDATKCARCVVIVTDETDGQTLAVSDGTSWLRVSDGEEVN